MFLLVFFCRFLYDGARIADDDTPLSLEMEDNGALSTVFLPSPLETDSFALIPRYNRRDG